MDRRSSALDLGIPLTLIGEAVFARCLSAIKEERVAASQGAHRARRRSSTATSKAFVEDVRAGALRLEDRLATRRATCCMRAAAKEHRLEPQLRRHRAACGAAAASSARRFLGKIKEAFDKNPELANLLLDPFFRDKVDQRARTRWRRVVAAAVANGMPVPGLRDRARLLRRLPRRRACRRTCCRPSATTSARTPTSASTSRAASSSTPTGPAAAARPRRRRTPSRRTIHEVGSAILVNGPSPSFVRSFRFLSLSLSVSGEPHGEPAQRSRNRCPPLRPPERRAPRR